MASNDQIILEQILGQQKADMEIQLSNSEIFERFVADQVLKDFDLSVDEIEMGIVDGGDDGGIDSLYVFVNDEILSVDTDTSYYNRRNIKMHLFIMQSKATKSFSELSIERLIIAANDLLNLSNLLPPLIKHYNSKLLQIIEKFQKSYKDLSGRYLPELSITYIYATWGDAQNIHPNVIWKKDKLQAEVLQLFSHCNFDFKFLGASELLQLYRKVPTTNLSLHLLENATSTTFSNAQGYLCLVSLEKYYDFITDNGKLRTNIFEANIRDYQGQVEVNKGISDTLKKESQQDFWWLNNGITIIANKGTIVGKTITLEDAQVVNGLQTSNEIYRYYKENLRIKDDRSILVRIIVTDDLASRDKIIKATNSQTSIPPASLHATDTLQRNIEDLFSSRGGLYYDRRKNYYKNQGISRDRILGIPFLAQAVMAMVFQEPDSSRGKPSSLLKEDSSYEKLFNNKYPIELYWICAKIMKQVEVYIKSSDKSIEEKNNVGFHVAMYVVIMKMKRIRYKPQDVANISLESITPKLLSDCLEQVVLVFQDLKRKSNRQLDVIAKNRESTIAVLKHFEEQNPQIEI